MKIYIDFQGGAHGNYLEFVCNKFLAKIPCSDSPFNMLGASHNKQYFADEVFKAWHYFYFRGVTTSFKDKKIISIRITIDDLLPLTSISLLRAGDYGLHNNSLEINTYFKLQNGDYKWVLENLINGFFKDTLVSDYYSVKSDMWPDISDSKDFDNLPDWIREECINIHGIAPLKLDENNPNCPRNILREFFKIGFKYPLQHGFMTEQEKMKYDLSNSVYEFPYINFYDSNRFVNEMHNIAKHTGYDFSPNDEFLQLHAEFLSKQPYKTSKKFCDSILERIYTREQFDLPNLDLLQESYLAAQIELRINKELPNNTSWFSNSQQILELIT